MLPSDGTVRALIDNANPNQLADIFRAIAFGSFLQGQVTQVRRGVNPHTLGNSKYVHSTLDAIKLPDGGKAAVIHRATVRGYGEYAPQAYGTTPSTHQIAVSPSGDIVVLTSDNVASLDIVYTPERGDVLELVLPVVSDTLTPPAGLLTNKGPIVLLTEVEALEGTDTGLFEVTIPAAANSTTKTACLNLAKTAVLFDSANAVTRARVKFLVAAAEDLCDLLEGTTL